MTKASAPSRSPVPLTLVLACAVLFALVSPLRGMLTARGDVNAMRAEERVLDRRIAALRAERDLLATDAEIERRARADLGMVRPGEVAVIIPGAAEPPSRVPSVAAPPAEAADTTSGPSLLRRWWTAARRLAGVHV